MPKQTVAEKLALQSLASSTQPGLALPIEILDRIIGIYIEDRCRPVWGIRRYIATPIPIPLLLTSKITKHLAIPHVYSHIVLHGKNTYTSFIKKASLESLRHVKKVIMCNVDLGCKTALKAEASAIRSLEKRIAAYMLTLSKKLGRQGDEVLPSGVVFELKRFGTRFNHLPIPCYVNRLMKLFSMSTLRYHGPPDVAMHLTFDPLSDSTSHWRFPKVMLEHEWKFARDPPADSLLYPATHVFEQVHLEIAGLDSDPGTRAIHVPSFVLSIQAACDEVNQVVSIELKGIPHAFCRGKDVVQQVLRSPKLRLRCCSGRCDESVSRNYAICKIGRRGSAR